MLKLKSIRRVTVYADGSLEPILLQKFLDLGSNGYTITPCHGKGEHDSVDDPFAKGSRVRIELLVKPEVALKILAYIDGPAFKHHAAAACMETVEVAETENY